MYLINIYIEVIQRESKVLPVFIIGAYNPHNMRYAESRVFMADKERKLQELIGKENEKKGVIIDSKNRQRILDDKMRIWDVRIKHV